MAGSGVPLQEDSPLPQVLVVDDDHSVRALVEFYFRGAPWAAVFTVDGTHALAAFRSQGFALVLLDLEMPVLGGEATAKAMRHAEAETGQRPAVILALSAHMADDCPVSPYFDGSVAKPFTRLSLMGAVERALGLDAGLPKASTADIPCGDNEETDPALRPLLPKLFESVAELAADAAAGLECGDMKAVARAGHKIRGAASCFKVRALSEAAALLEQAAEKQNAAEAAAALDTVASILLG